MRTDVKLYVAKCPDCQKCKSKNYKSEGEMSDIPRGFEPFSAIAIDVVGPLPKSKKQNQYLLTAIDMSTKFLFAKAVRAANAFSFLRFLLFDIFLIFGFPNLIMSDNAKMFTGKLFQEV